MVACLGWPITIVRFLPSERYQRRLVTIMIASVLLLGTATVAMVELVAGPLLFGALHIPRGTTDVILSLILVVVGSVGAVTDAALISQRATMVVLVKNFIGGVAKIVALFVFAPLGTTGLVMAATLGGVLAVVLGVGGLWRRIPRSAGHSQGLERGALHYVRYSATGYISSLFGILPMTVVPLVVLGVLGATPAGWFSMAFLIGGLLAVVPSTASQVLFAEGSRAPEHLRTNVITAIKAIYGGLAPAALLLFALAPVIMSLLGPEYEAHATGALRAYAAGSLFLGATYVVDSILMATDRMRAYLMINALNSLLVVALVAIFAGQGLTAVGLAWAAAQGLSVGIGGAILIAPRVYRAGRRRALLPVREPSA
jgi:O-antigen/teichoic acid export membrane protein